MTFRHFREEDYDAVCNFLQELNKKSKNHINWNWARFEWMYEHPMFDKSLKNSIYAYVEPVCTIPSYRGTGAAKAVIYEALSRAKALGAKQAYVISDMEFYEKLGFEKDLSFTFYRKV